MRGIQRLRADKKAIPGFGHPQHAGGDPRANLLLELAGERGIAGPHIEMLYAIKAALPDTLGRPLPVNVNGPIPAIMLDLGWPKKVTSHGGILVDKNSAANISDTQTATFDFGDLPVVWQHRTWGEAAQKPAHPWGATFYGDKGTLVANVQRFDFTPRGKDKPTVSGEAVYEYDKFPEDKTEKDLERHVATVVFFDQGEREVHSGGDACRRPQVAVANEDRIRIHDERGEPLR